MHLGVSIYFLLCALSYPSISSSQRRSTHSFLRKKREREYPWIRRFSSSRRRRRLRHILTPEAAPACMCPVGEIPPPHSVYLPHRRAHRAPEPTGPQAQSYATVRNGQKNINPQPPDPKPRRPPKPKQNPQRSPVRRRRHPPATGSRLLPPSAAGPGTSSRPPASAAGQRELHPAPGSHFPHQKPPDFQESPGCR